MTGLERSRGMPGIEEQLIGYCRETFAAEVASDTRLIEKGIIDSMGIMELVGYIEQQFGIELEMDDMTIDNFGAVSAIKALIMSKGGAA